MTMFLPAAFLAFAMFFQGQAPAVNPRPGPDKPTVANATPATDQTSAINRPPKDSDLGIHASPLSQNDVYLAYATLGFGLLALVLQLYAMRSIHSSAEDVLRTFSVTLVITLTLFLIASGWDNNKIAPAMGLFGTLVGYVLGRRSSTPPQGAAAQPPDGEKEKE
jgi:hypothetical protein